MTFLQLEDLTAENRRLAERYDRVKELMKQFEERPSMCVGDDLESLMRKARKLKEVKEENKKLRRLLQYASHDAGYSWTTRKRSGKRRKRP